MEKTFTQAEAAVILGYKHPRSLNKLIEDGVLECVKMPGRNGHKLFREKHIVGFLNSLEI
jgi:hypothetical protein